MAWIYKYTKSFSLGVKNSLEYRTNFFLSFISVIFPIIIQFSLWTTVYKNIESSTMFGFSYNQMITYSLLASIAAKLVVTGFENEVASDIKEGGLNKFVVRPVGYLGYRVSCFLGQKVFQSSMYVVVMISVLIGVNVFSGAAIDAGRIIIFVISILMALLLNFTIFFCISTLAFWLTDVWGLFVGMGVVVNIISGGVVPLDIFGSKLLAILKLLPFQYTIYFPVRIINGTLTINESLEGIAIQCTWIAVISIIAVVLWTKGIKKYVAVGG